MEEVMEEEMEVVFTHFSFCSKVILVVSGIVKNEKQRCNKAAFIESRRGFVARVQESRGGFRKMRLYFTVFNTKQPRGHKK